MEPEYTDYTTQEFAARVRCIYIDQCLDSLSHGSFRDGGVIDSRVFRFHNNIVFVKWSRLFDGLLGNVRRYEALETCARHLDLDSMVRLQSSSRQLRSMPASAFPWDRVLADIDRRWPEGGDWERPTSPTGALPQPSFCSSLRAMDGLPDEMRDPRAFPRKWAELPDDRARCRAIGDYRRTV